jgi:cytochrome P450
MTDTVAIPEIEASVFNACFLSDPYPTYAHIRELGPLVRLRDGAASSWVCAHYADVAAIQRDTVTFSSRRARMLFGWIPEDARAEFEYIMGVYEMFMVFNDGQQHAAARKVLQVAFTSIALEGLRPDVAALADVLIATMSGGGRVEFVEEFARRFPACVIMQILGVPQSDFDECLRWSDRLVAFAGAIRSVDLEKVRAAQQAVKNMMEYFGRLMEARRGLPREDLMSHMVTAQRDQGLGISDEELQAQCCLLLLNGNETTRNLLSSGLYLLLSNRLRPGDVGASAESLNGFVEEVLRYESPSQFFRRIVAEDTVLRGVPIAKGDSFMLIVGAANRDPRRFEEPDRFDPRRSDNKHLSFGFGPHLCIGAALTRFEARIAFERLFRCFPDMLLADPEPHWNMNPAFRGLARLELDVG